MSEDLVDQWSTYSASEWIVFSLVALVSTWVGGFGGAFLSHVVNCVLVYLSDTRQIMSQPGGDLDIVFWGGFLNRMISINILLSFVVALPMLLIRKTLLRFDSWSGALFSWRMFPSPKVRPAIKHAAREVI